VNTLPAISHVNAYELC